jgi:hypothetical protein
MDRRAMNGGFSPISLVDVAFDVYTDSSDMKWPYVEALVFSGYSMPLTLSGRSHKEAESPSRSGACLFAETGNAIRPTVGQSQQRSKCPPVEKPIVTGHREPGAGGHDDMRLRRADDFRRHSHCSHIWTKNSQTQHDRPRSRQINVLGSLCLKHSNSSHFCSVS